MNFDYLFEFVKCGTCGKEFLVEKLLVGTNHTASILVTCKDCLQKKELPKKFMEQYPEESNAIIRWLKNE